MRSKFLLVFSLIAWAPIPWALTAWPAVANAQTSPAPYEIAGGYSYLSNSYNGVSGHQGGLNGWDASVAFPGWHNLRFKMDFAQFNGTNYGAKENGYFIMGGGQYDHKIHRETLFGEALFGELGTNQVWGPNGSAGQKASFATQIGGGLDTPINPHFSFRVEGDYRYENLALALSTTNPTPIYSGFLPKNFASVSTGLVWTPRLGSSSFSPAPAQPRSPVESELVFESTNSFGHFNIFADTRWSYLHVAGLEYDRHSWGQFIGARMDYVAEILPVSIFKQPSGTTVWGNPTVSPLTFTTIYGLGIAPIGLRMMWRDGRAWKPYYEVKGGLIGFNKKAISQYASYLNFSLQQSIGFQLRLTNRWEMRAGIEHFHISNAFMVPSNPGADEMSYTTALSYQLGKKHNTE